MRTILAPIFFVCIAHAQQTAVPAPVDEATLEKFASTPAGRAVIGQVHLKRVAAPAIAGLSESPEGKRFLDELFASPELLGDFLYSGNLSEDPGKALRVLFSIWKQDREGLKDPRDRGTAAAVALTFGRKGWPEDKAFARYKLYRDARNQKLLHPSFETLAPWEKRFVVSASGNGGWQDDTGWGDASLVWLRDNVKLPADDYTGACWQAPYHLNNLFGDSIHGSTYYKPFSGMLHAKRVRDVGGVCGSLSHYGANAAQANGIPALTMGEPGHCAYAVRPRRGEWQPAYSLSWKRGLHFLPWEGSTWTRLILCEKAMGSNDIQRTSTALGYQALALEKSNPELAETAYRLALEKQPLNLPVWFNAVDFFRNVLKPDAAQWSAIEKGILASLAAYPEAAWDVLARIAPQALQTMPAEKQQEFFLAYHRAIAREDGPVMWEFEKALSAQAKELPGREITFFENVLKLQIVSKSWLAPTVAWGQEEFTKDPAATKQYFGALGTAFSSGSKDNSDSMRKALGAAVLAAEGTKDVEAFQAVGKAGAALGGTKEMKTEPFPGDLLSSGGMILPSSTCGWDHPENHWGVLEKTGGAFHTASQVRPYVVARLGKLGNLSGIVIHGTGGPNADRQVPFKVSISEDGATWTEVFRTDKPASMWRIPLDGRALRVQFVKCERDDDRKEFFHLNAIHAYGRRLQ